MPGTPFDHLGIGDIDKDFGEMFGGEGGGASFRFPTSHVAPPSAFRRGQAPPSAASPVTPVQQMQRQRPPPRPARPDDGRPVTAYPDLNLNEQPPAARGQAERAPGGRLADDLIAEINLRPSYPVEEEDDQPRAVPRLVPAATPVRSGAEGALRPVAAPVRVVPRRHVRSLSVLPAVVGEAPSAPEQEGERAALYRTLAETYARLAALEVRPAAEPPQAPVEAVPVVVVAAPEASGDDVPVEHDDEIVSKEG